MNADKRQSGKIIKVKKKVHGMSFDEVMKRIVRVEPEKKESEEVEAEKAGKNKR